MFKDSGCVVQVCVVKMVLHATSCVEWKVQASNHDVGGGGVAVLQFAFLPDMKSSF